VSEDTDREPSGEEAAQDETLLEPDPTLLDAHSETVGHPGPNRGGDSLRRPTEAHPARRIGRFVLERELGRGGMGIVYQARDSELKRVVALKTFLEAAGISADGLARFRREAGAAGRLKDPRIVTVHEVGEHDGRPFIVMDLIEGESLEAFLRRGLPPPHQAAQIVRELALALAHAHEQGVIHRDVKPENVLLDSEGRPHLTDFGLAREIADTERLTASGAILGTPSYMAPEQASGSLEQHGPPCDIYGLGALLYRALVGRPPFVAPSIRVLIKRILFDEPTPPRKLDPGVAVDLETIALRCLAKEPARRYADARSLAEDLDRFVEGRPILARPPTRLERLSLTARRNPGTSAALLALALSLAGGAGVLGVSLAREARERRADEARAQKAHALDETRRARVADVLDRVGRAPNSARSPLADKEALNTLVECRHPETVAVLSRELEALAGELAKVRLEQYLSTAGADTPQPVDGDVQGALAAALARQAALEPGQVLGAPDRALVRAAGRSLEERWLREHPRPRNTNDPPQRPRRAREIVADAQTQRLGADRRRLARISCEALGQIAEGRPALAALEAVLAADEDEPSAAAAALALCRIGGVQGKVRVRERSRAFGSASAFTERVRAAMALTLTEERTLPHNASGLLARAESCAQRGDLSSALEHLGRALTLEPSNGLLWRARAESHLALRHLEAACEDLTQALELNPRDALSLSLRGTARASRGRLDEALADCSSALEIDPGDLRLWTNRAEVYRTHGKLELAIADYGRAIAIDPASPQAFWWRGRARTLLHRGPAAVLDLTHALARSPENPEILIDLALAHAEASAPSLAVASATQAIELRPSEALGWLTRAQVRPDLEAALADASRALELAPNLAKAWAVRASVHQRLGKPTAAVNDLSKAIKLEPGDTGFWGNRATARALEGDHRGARADASQALKLDPKNVEARCTLAANRLAAGDFPGARDEYSRALEHSPSSPVALAGRGEARRLCGDAKGALTDLQQATRAGAVRATTWIYLGLAQRDTGNHEAAVTAYSRALALDPRDPNVWFARAQAHQELRKLEQAIRDYERFLTLAPTHPNAQLARSIVSAMRRHLKQR
jgi:tetratricopeptide (TPR) repeat protein